MDVCPENCLSLVPLSQFEFSGDVVEQPAVETQLHIEGQLQHLEASELSQCEGSVMVKDETICIRCGLCAERCPAHTITMEAYEVFDRDPELVQIEGITVRP